MNYRHIYHAGNFADVMKHALLLRLLAAMKRKDKPFLVLDTHAGIGRYDVSSAQAAKTGEWRDGIGKLLETAPPALTTYVEAVNRIGLYPGSPVLVADALRPSDRLIACELHPEDAMVLRRTMRAYANTAVHERDGYEALRAFLPPPEKRALVLIDPPFERTDEFAVLAEKLVVAWSKFPTAVFVVWYPIKHRAPVRAFFESLKASEMRDVVAAELLRRPDTNPTGLNGAGLLLVNPPYGFEAEADEVLQACADVFGEAGAQARVERVIGE